MAAVPTLTPVRRTLRGPLPRATQADERRNLPRRGNAVRPVTSRNITPDEETGKPELTIAQFKEVLRKGTDFEHQHPQFGPLLQVMAWPVFQDMTDRDIRAIYEYLRSIPHAEPGNCSGAGEGAP
jgi:hypothetical protein